MAGQAAEARSAPPAPELGPFVDSYSGIRYDGFAPGAHVGLPSRHLTVAISLSGALHVAVPDRSPAPRPFMAFAAGLHARPAIVAHNGSQHLVSLELTPLGARTLLGVPAAELAGTVVELDDLLGGEAQELVDRLAAAAGWQARFAILDDILTRRSRRQDVFEGPAARAWHHIVVSGGTLRIGELARETGYSRRQLTKRFTGEYGLTPKQASRVMRFERSWHLLRRLERRRRASPGSERRSLAELAVGCGYYDQSHLAVSGTTSPAARPRPGSPPKSSHSSKTRQPKTLSLGDMSAYVWPNLGYRDAKAAIHFLVNAVGFEAVAVYERKPDGSVAHAELRWPGGGGVMLHTAGASPRYSVHVGTSEPDALFARAVAAGADVVREVENSRVGTRGFIVSDPMGLYWSFGTPLPALERDEVGRWRPPEKA